jgi:prepilin-type N-terminal cleavage/methylation domain-containing protein
MMLSLDRRSKRGFTLAELLTVIVMVALFFTIAFAIINPITHAASQATAKLETVQTATQGFYVIQRDLRESDYNAVFLCDTTGGCGTASDPVIAIATANDSSGHIQLNSGAVQWTGFYVYWTKSGVLYRSYQPVASISQPPTSGDATNAVKDATPGSPNAGDTFLVGDYSLTAGYSSPATITLTMIARSSQGGSSNQTTYQSNVVPRNTQ